MNVESFLILIEQLLSNNVKFNDRRNGPISQKRPLGRFSKYPFLKLETTPKQTKK
jgi:hypothetical protein